MAKVLNTSGLWLKVDWKYTKFEFPAKTQFRESTSNLKQLSFREMSKWFSLTPQKVITRPRVLCNLAVKIEND